MPVSTDRRQGVNPGAAVKVPCRCATTANITLSGLQTIDGVAVVADDRILVKDQTTASQNGIYKASTSTWQRDIDFDGPFDVVEGTLVHVNQGTTQGESMWRVGTSGTIVLDTTSLSFERAVVNDSSSVAFLQSGSAVARSVESRLRDTVHIFDFIPPQDHNGIIAGTDSNDHASEIQEAIDTLSSGGIIFLPRGTFIANGITLKKKIILRGAGRDHTILRRSSSGGPTVKIDDTDWVFYAGLEDMYISNTGAANTDHAIYWKRIANAGPAYSHFARLAVRAYNGVHMEGDDTSGAIWNSWHDVRADGCDNHGWYWKGVNNQNTLINCQAWENDKDGIRFELGTSSGAQNITLINFASERNGEAAGAAVRGLYARGVTGLHIVGFYGERNGPDSDFGAALSLNSAHLWLQDCKAVDIRTSTFNKANYAIALTNCNARVEQNEFLEIGSFTNRKFSIGFQQASRLNLGQNYIPSGAAVTFLNNVDSDIDAITGLLENGLGSGEFYQTLGGRKFLPSTDPRSLTAAQYDFAVPTTPAIGGPVLYHQLSVGVWRPVAQNVRIGPTANRPTLHAQDIGIMYMDTTLDADGKPIWWNGTAWVDATGVTV